MLRPRRRYPSPPPRLLALVVMMVMVSWSAKHGVFCGARRGIRWRHDVMDRRGNRIRHHHSHDHGNPPPPHQGSLQNELAVDIGVTGSTHPGSRSSSRSSSVQSDRAARRRQLEEAEGEGQQQDDNEGDEEQHQVNDEEELDSPTSAPTLFPTLEPTMAPTLEETTLSPTTTADIGDAAGVVEDGAEDTVDEADKGQADPAGGDGDGGDDDVDSGQPQDTKPADGGEGGQAQNGQAQNGGQDEEEQNQQPEGTGGSGGVLYGGGLSGEENLGKNPSADDDNSPQQEDEEDGDDSNVAKPDSPGNTKALLGTIIVLAIIVALFVFIWVPSKLRKFCRRNTGDASGSSSNVNNGVGIVDFDDDNDDDTTDPDIDATDLTLGIEDAERIQNSLYQIMQDGNFATVAGGMTLQDRKEYIANVLISKRVVLPDAPSCVTNRDKDLETIANARNEISKVKTANAKKLNRNSSEDDDINTITTSCWKSVHSASTLDHAANCSIEEGSTSLSMTSSKSSIRSGSITSAGSQYDKVCAICLTEYVNGDTICWSHNRRCKHKFHRECITKWLISHDDCPCCRCSYLSVFDEDDDHYRRRRTRGSTTRSGRRSGGQEEQHRQQSPLSSASIPSPHTTSSTASRRSTRQEDRQQSSHPVDVDDYFDGGEQLAEDQDLDRQHQRPPSFPIDVDEYYDSNNNMAPQLVRSLELYYQQFAVNSTSTSYPSSSSVSMITSSAETGDESSVSTRRTMASTINNHNHNHASYYSERIDEEDDEDQQHEQPQTPPKEVSALVPFEDDVVDDEALMIASVVSRNSRSSRSSRSSSSTKNERKMKRTRSAVANDVTTSSVAQLDDDETKSFASGRSGRSIRSGSGRAQRGPRERKKEDDENSGVYYDDELAMSAAIIASIQEEAVYEGRAITMMRPQSDPRSSHHDTSSDQYSSHHDTSSSSTATKATSNVAAIARRRLNEAAAITLLQATMPSDEDSDDKQ